MGRRNFPCSTVNAQTVNSMGARFWSSRRASQQRQGVLAAGQGHRYAIPIADHLEPSDRFAYLPQECFFEIHVNRTAAGTGWPPTPA